MGLITHCSQCVQNKHPITENEVIALHLLMLWMRVCGLDDLCSGVQQNGIGVWFGPEEPITVVEVVGECLRELVGAAVFVILVSLYYRLWRVSLPEVARV